MVCPAISDPFRGRYWRVAAVFHQTFFVAVHGKIYCWGAQNISRFVSSVFGNAAPITNCHTGSSLQINGNLSNGLHPHVD